MLCACPGQDSDGIPLQQAAKAFQRHCWMLQCKDCSIKHRLRYFEAVVSSTACFVAEHRPLHRKHLEKYDVQFRKFVRRIVGPPPPGTTWSAQWRDFLHDWNLRADHWSHASGNSSWSRSAWLNTGISLVTLLMNVGWGEHAKTSSNVSFLWTPTISLGG